MTVDRWHKAETNGSPNGLRDLSLIDRSQAGFASVLDTAHGGDVFGHDSEVLSECQLISPKNARAKHELQSNLPCKGPMG